tara:strand:+ start:3488 stop:3841 length:354 start_codon:yes stop_codon:yes gene_type:complete
MVFTQVNLNSKLNVSLQIGDLVFVSHRISTALNVIGKPIFAGVVEQINSSGIVVKGQSGIFTEPVDLNTQQFLSFSKDISVNESSLKGYYADVTFKNTSPTAAELFAVSTDVVPSSK